jgi:cytochrome c biogenesis protein CcmG, thiol:disulfide interchange protein DsbE
MKRAMLSLVVLAASCSTSAPTGPTPVSMPAHNATVAPLLPTQAPGLTSSDPERFRALLSQLRGTPVIVNVWASWCGPCREEAPLLAAAAGRDGDRIQFLGIDILDTKDAAARFTEEFRIPYPSLFDPDAAIRDSLGFLGQPVTMFYDAGGKRVQTESGPLDQQSLTTGIAALLQPAEP